jgi:hypothetical protein
MAKSKKPSISSKSKKPAVKKEPRITMASVAYALIKKGASNAEVREVLKKDFKLPEKHDYYPAWYRSHMVQKGLIDKDFAGKHSGEPAKEKKVKAPKAKKASAAKPAVKKESAAPSAS